MMLYCSSFIFLSLSSISLLQQHLLQAFSTSTLSKSRIIPKRYSSSKLLDLLNPRSYSFKLFSVYEKDKVGTEPLDWPNLGSVKLI
jgi:hypothetical protein